MDVEMCLMAPAHVLAVEPDFAVVELDGRRRRASTLLVEDVAVGDWVLVAGGAVVRCLDAEQAAEMARAVSVAAGQELDADSIDEHLHYPTEDRDPVLDHRPLTSSAHAASHLLRSQLP
jgi:hydrogenase expression/formation protein HypC